MSSTLTYIRYTKCNPYPLKTFRSYKKMGTSGDTSSLPIFRQFYALHEEMTCQFLCS